jgi:hypothetical protein
MVTDTAPLRYPHYHKPSDTTEKLRYDFLNGVVQGIESVLCEMVVCWSEHRSCFTDSCRQGPDGYEIRRHDFASMIKDGCAIRMGDEKEPAWIEIRTGKSGHKLCSCPGPTGRIAK